jgi:hypothetical protein
MTTHGRARRLALALAALLARPAPVARACAPVTRGGERVEIAAERALVVWDPVRRIEHFVRAAAFETASRDFGFLVPTPSVPTLAAETRALFDALATHARPPVIVRRPWVLSPTLSCLLTLRARRTEAAVASGPMPESVAPAPDPVRVLSEQQVSGYDAVVLEASDPAALTRWLEQHRYATTPSLTAWLAPYVSRGWKLTAFKVAARDAQNPRQPILAPVRMTFATDAPFYPYREPASPPSASPAARPRRLELHVLSDRRLEGAIGASLPFPGRVTFSGPSDDLGARAVAWGLSAGLTRLTSFEDVSSPRPATDEVYFRAASSQRPYAPPPEYVDAPREVPIPLDLLGLVGLGIVFVRRVRARARAAGDPSKTQ